LVFCVVIFVCFVVSCPFWDQAAAAQTGEPAVWSDPLNKDTELLGLQRGDPPEIVAG
jgi:hypothetical protein